MQHTYIHEVVARDGLQIEPQLQVAKAGNATDLHPFPGRLH